MNKNFYGMNNSKGVHVDNLKDSVYSIKKYIYPEMIIFDELDKFDFSNPKLRNFEAIVDSCTKVYNYSGKLIKEGLKPILFAGDHAIAIGSIAASAKNYDDLHVLWIDSHSDINSEESTITGNIHGMPLRFLLGEGKRELANLGGNIRHENIIYLGLRDVDPEEAIYIKRNNIKGYYYDEIKEKGIEIIMDEIIDLVNNKNLHVSFDFDSMDPKIFPAVSVPVESGFTVEEVDIILDKILNKSNIVSFDFVEYNHAKDKDNKCLEIAKYFIKKVTDKIK